MRRLLLAVAIIAVTALAIRTIAARKNEELAGPGTYRLAAEGPERDAFETLLRELDQIDDARFAARLRRLDAEGHLWVAPFMPEGHQALFIDSLGLVRRIYVERSALMFEELPFAGAGLPDDWRRLYAVVRLGGTLYHELQHYDGVLDEADAYRRETAWYAAVVRTGYVRSLSDKDRRRYNWAIESAELSVKAAAAAAEAAAGGS